jgi:hypothetical protein
LHRKHSSAYIKPTKFYRNYQVKRVVGLINEKLGFLHKGHLFAGQLTYAPSTLAYKLTKKFNTITYAKYHLHTAEGRDCFKSIPVEIIRIITSCLTGGNLLNRDDILLYPEGRVRINMLIELSNDIKITWEFKIKPAIKKLLNI